LRRPSMSTSMLMMCSSVFQATCASPYVFFIYPSMSLLQYNMLCLRLSRGLATQMRRVCLGPYTRTPSSLARELHSCCVRSASCFESLALFKVYLDDGIR
jgi:hypothetical protein